MLESRDLLNAIMNIAKSFQYRNPETSLPMGAALNRERLLIILSEQPAGYRLKDLAHIAGITPATAKAHLSKMPDYVHSDSSENDKRERIYTLTEAGLKRAHEITSAWNSYIDARFSPLSNAEKQTLLSLLRKIEFQETNTLPRQETPVLQALSGLDNSANTSKSIPAPNDIYDDEGEDDEDDDDDEDNSTASSPYRGYNERRDYDGYDSDWEDYN